MDPYMPVCNGKDRAKSHRSPVLLDMGVLVIPHLHALQQILILRGFAEGVCYYFGGDAGWSETGRMHASLSFFTLFTTRLTAYGSISLAS